MAEKKKKPDPVPENTGRDGNLFSKSQLLAAERFRERRDILNALLADDRKYTAAAVEEMINGFMERKVI